MVPAAAAAAADGPREKGAAEEENGKEEEEEGTGGRRKVRQSPSSYRDLMTRMSPDLKLLVSDELHRYI